MATIIETSLQGHGQRAATEVTLTASNVLTYKPGRRQILILRNPTGGAISSVIDGADGATEVVQGYGPVDVSAGYAVGSIPAGAVRVIPLDTIYPYLQGAINVTGTGLVAVLLGS